MLNYLSVVAPVIAILNGVIAVYATQFKPEDRSIKIALLSLAIVLGVIAAGTSVWAQHTTLVKQQAEKDAKSEVRLKLAEHIARAHRIMASLTDNNYDKHKAMEEAVNWSNDTQRYLESLGNDYAVRFVDTSGLGAMMAVGTLDNDRQNYWSVVYNRNARLNQFILEFTQ